MISKSETREIFAEMKKQGYDITSRDLAFYFLCTIFEDETFVYRVIFGLEPEIPLSEYTVSNKLQGLKAFLDGRYNDNDSPSGKDVLSFDELKSGLVEDMNALIELRDSKDDDGFPTLEPKEMATVVARIADIRVKLTEKFGTTEKSAEQRVVVFQKYDSICPYCGHEIAIGIKK